MTRVLVLYTQPADTVAFDRYYFDTHVPIAAKLPGLRSYVVSAGRPALLAGKETPYLIAELDFETQTDFQAALSSPEGQATTGDLANFAQSGVTIVAFEIRQL